MADTRFTDELEARFLKLEQSQGRLRFRVRKLEGLSNPLNKQEYKILVLRTEEPLKAMECRLNQEALEGWVLVTVVADPGHDYVAFLERSRKT